MQQWFSTFSLFLYHIFPNHFVIFSVLMNFFYIFFLKKKKKRLTAIMQHSYVCLNSQLPLFSTTNYAKAKTKINKYKANSFTLWSKLDYCSLNFSLLGKESGYFIGFESQHTPLKQLISPSNNPLGIAFFMRGIEYY